MSTLLTPLSLLAFSGAALRPHFAAPTARVARCAVSPLAVSLPFGSSGSNSDGPSDEVLEKYRLLGLGEDATYDDIESAYAELAEKYQGDTKMTIKLQVAKDKIFDHLLRLRMSGKLKATVAESPFDSPVVKQPLIRIPVFMSDFMELPKKEDLLKNALIFGGIGLFGCLSKSWASTSVSLGFAMGLFLLYNRGAPESSNAEDASMRPPKAKPLAMAAGITLLAGAIGGSLSQLMVGVLRFLAPESLIGVGTSIAWFVTATLFKVQDEY